MSGTVPLTRLVALAAIVQMSLMLNHPFALAPLLIIVIVGALLAGAGRTMLRLLGLLVSLPVLSVFLWTVAFPARGRWSAASTLFGFGMGLRLAVLLVAGVAFIAVTRPDEMSHVLRQLKVPYRFAFSFTLALRLFPLFAESARTIVMAQRARGIAFGASRGLGRFRRYVPLLVPVLASGLRQADRLSIALEGRGFGARRTRISYLEHRFGFSDVILLVALLVMEGAILWVWHSGRGTIG
jgi:energy-coupling factor transport system permease protein